MRPEIEEVPEMIAAMMEDCENRGESEIVNVWTFSREKCVISSPEQSAKQTGFGVYTLRQSRYIFADGTVIGLASQITPAIWP